MSQRLDNGLDRPSFAESVDVPARDFALLRSLKRELLDELRSSPELENPVTPEALLSAYHDAWRRCLSELPGTPVRFNKGEDIHRLSTLAHRIIQTFVASDVASPVGRIVGVEEELKVVLHPDLPDLVRPRANSIQ